MRNEDLIVHLARFAATLRAYRVEVRISDELDATKALTLVDLFDKEEIRRVLHITFKIQPRDRMMFDRLFASFWVGGRAESNPRVQTAAPQARGVTPPRPYPQSTTQTGDSDRSATPAEDQSVGYSPDLVLRRKPFEACSDRDFADMERLLARLLPRWTARRSRRLTPVRGRGMPDVRRSFRRAVGTGGEMLSLARRARAIDDPRVVVLCDTSGSMDAHVRFLLAFVMAFKRIARRTEVFAFNTSLVHLTPWLEPARIVRTLERLASGVPGWSGGTRIGESLVEFVTKYLDDVVSSRSVVVILSDGLDRGDTSGIADAMRALHSKARRIIWLNPLSGDPRYEPTARAMQAALPFIDRLAPAHDLESLERILPELAA
jgi:uncharacterized protein with von Willebrand factor type A (vWA) domain